MKKPRFLAGSLGGLLLAAIFALGVSTLATPAAEAGNCICPPGTPTQVTEWGMGSTCAAAKANCSARAHSKANNTVCTDGVCRYGGIWYNFPNCYDNFKVDCVLSVACENCIQFPDM